MAMRSSDMEVSEAMADANQDDDIEPLSGQPFFHVMLTKSQVGAKRVYQMTLPVHFTRILPNKTVPVTLTCSGKSWEMIYLGKGSRFNKFGPSGWKTFVVDNMLKVGDFCVFELMENSDIALNFKVRILRGNFPSVLENKEAGTIENPIVLE